MFEQIKIQKYTLNPDPLNKIVPPLLQIVDHVPKIITTW